MNTHWLADKNYSTKRKFVLPKFFIKLLYSSLIVLFLFVAFQNPSTGSHSIADDSAEREQSSFLELGAGCVAPTEWFGYEEYEPEAILLSGSFYSDALLDKYKDYDNNGEITAQEVEDFFALENDLMLYFGNANELYSRFWSSLPPVVGDYAAVEWEGPRINATYDSYTLQKNGMGFADGLRKLYQGSNVVWYHPRITDVNKSYILKELDDAITDKIITEKADFYLHPLPIPVDEYDLFPRNIYYTKLGFTQSCSEFNIKIFEEFYK